MLLAAFTQVDVVAIPWDGTMLDMKILCWEDLECLSVHLFNLHRDSEVVEHEDVSGYGNNTLEYSTDWIGAPVRVTPGPPHEDEGSVMITICPWPSE